MVTDFGSVSTISDQREQVTDQDTNHSRAMAVRYRRHRKKDIGGVGTLGQARTRSCGKISAPLRGPNRIPVLHS